MFLHVSVLQLSGSLPVLLYFYHSMGIKLFLHNTNSIFASKPEKVTPIFPNFVDNFPDFSPISLLYFLTYKLDNFTFI